MKLATATTAIAATAAVALLPSASGCSRVLENKYDTVVAGRSMDWSHQFYDYLLIHPKGQEMDGGSPTGSNSIQWKSTYGSVVSSIV
ncbi:hypothetical protein QTG54_009152 [Skeletonema marinoi]|uniref:Uncharacterized protein n=1 Tax=Skeletonema marinoi TaxID=267567 RepID=A0AAD9DAI8_9STRA|nr:hypothetical protein QTG54_009152 [Skeletonema marinoi]